MSGTSFPEGFAVEVNFIGPESEALILDDATRGLLDTGELGGSDLAWVDITERVRAGSIVRGVSRFDGVYGRAEAGVAVLVLDNRDAALDPSNLAGPYVAAGVSQVQPMVAVRIRGGGFDLWRGFADGWDLTYPEGGHDAVCTFRGTDGTKVLVGFNGPEQGSQGAGEDAGARIARILDNAGWPAADRDLDVGLTDLEPTTLAQPAWTDILLASDTELGEVYFTPAGKVRFRNRHAPLTETRSTTVQATFSDDGTEDRYAEIEVATDDTQLANLIRIDGPGVSEQVAEDPDSQARYLVRSWVRTDLLMRTDVEAHDYASTVLGLLGTAELRFDGLTITPGRDPENLWPQALGRELGDRIAAEFTPPGRPGDPIERECFVRGIAHAFAAGSAWRTRWALQDASRLNLFVLDHATLGVLDESRLAF